MSKTETIWAGWIGMATVIIGVILFIGAVYQHDIPMAKATFVILAQGAWLLSLGIRVRK